MSSNWKTKEKRGLMEARFEFATFDDLHDFLEKVEGHSEALNHFPNISFGKNQASISIYAKTGELGEIDTKLASLIDESFEQINNK